MVSVSFPSKGPFENLLLNSSSKKSNLESEPTILFRLIQEDFAQYAIHEQVVEVCIYSNRQVEVLTSNGIRECESNLSNIFTEDQLKTYAAQSETEDQWGKYINWRLTQYENSSRYHLTANISVLGGGGSSSKSGDSKNSSSANKTRTPMSKNPSSPLPAASSKNPLPTSLPEKKPSAPVKDSEEKEMFQRYKDDADKGIAQAQCMLGICCLQGKGVDKNPVEAVKWWRLAAEQNLPEAQFFLAQLYLDGAGVPKDLPEGLMLLQKAAKAGYEPAKELLQLIAGQVDSASSKQTTQADIDLLIKLAEQGTPSAQFSLGISYLAGDFVKKNPVEAVKWLRKAAEKDYLQAQVALGQCYHTGNGVPENSTEAVIWFRKAAEQGDGDSQYALGEIYYAGDGVARDYAQAFQWFLKAANKNLPQAQYFLALCYHTGNGIAQNYPEAVNWYRKSAAQGYQQALDFLKSNNL